MSCLRLSSSLDYLIDNLAETVDKKFMPEFNYVIIDEADAILLDSAQTPLIISGAPRVQSNLYGLVDNFILTLEEDQAYKLDEKRKGLNPWRSKGVGL